VVISIPVKNNLTIISQKKLLLGATGDWILSTGTITDIEDPNLFKQGCRAVVGHPPYLSSHFCEDNEGIQQTYGTYNSSHLKHHHS
jgi:hypothetical protein